jgi:hypothetical protein
MSRITKFDNLPVIDAKHPIKIVVNARDVSNADNKNPADCVLARACRRNLDVPEVRIHLSRAYVRANKGNWTRYIVPQSARSEIIAFDRGGKFETGEFVLTPPTKSTRLGQPSRKSGPSGTKKRRSMRIIKNVRARAM